MHLTVYLMGNSHMRSERSLDAYPSWLQQVIHESTERRLSVANHELWRQLADGSFALHAHRNLVVGFWPLVDCFPQFLALNLLKTNTCRDPAINGSRAWLSKNLQIEQRHAQWFLDWGEAFGTPRDEMFDGARPVEMTAITDWCWHVCQQGELADAMAATNYAIEGVTGEWTPRLAHSEPYMSRLTTSDAKKGMRWLRVHADYDDAHPWEALDLIGQLLGPDPATVRIDGVRDAIWKTYELYRIGCDVALERVEKPRVRANGLRGPAPRANARALAAAPA